MSAPEKWTTSHDADLWPGVPVYPTREEAIAAYLRDMQPHRGEVFHVGLRVDVDTDELAQIDMEELLDSIAQQAQDEHGEGADEWLAEVSIEAVASLRELLQGVLSLWLAKHAPPTFCRVLAIEECIASEKTGGAS